MPKTFDIKAVEAKLQRINDYKDPDYYWAVLGATGEYSDIKGFENMHFSFRTMSNSVSSSFHVTGRIPINRYLLSPRKSAYLGSILCQKATEDIKKEGSELSKIIQSIQIDMDPMQHQDLTVRIDGVVAPKPENFQFYIKTMDLCDMVKTWFNSAAAADAKEQTEKFERLVDSTRPK